MNGRSLVEQRFSEFLKQGLDIAGRKLRFLGYSTLGIREHTIWLMADFEHPEEGLVTPDKIRADLGEFTFKKSIKQLSGYAARIAQAVSGTDPSYKIKIGQWEEGIPDLAFIKPGLSRLCWCALSPATGMIACA